MVFIHINSAKCESLNVKFEYFAVFSCPFLWPVPHSRFLTAWHYTPLCFTAGIVHMSSAWFPPDMMLRTEVKSCSWQCESHLGAFFCVCVCVQTSLLRRGLHLAIKPSSVKWCSDGCTSAKFWHWWGHKSSSHRRICAFMINFWPQFHLI